MNRLILGDAVENTARLMPGSVPLTVTSPPYDDLFSLGAHFDFEGLAEQLWRVTALGGIVCWNVQDRIIDGSETGTSARQKLKFMEMGFRAHETLVTYKKWTNLGFAEFRYPRVWQHIFVLSKGRPRTFHPIKDRMTATAGYPSKYSIRNPISGERKQRIRTDRVVAETGVRMNAWELPTGGTTPTKDRFTSEHPARMPEALARDLILSYSNPGDLVLDPMNGVGTTTKMARLNSRRYLGIEINPQWHEIAMRRMAETEIDYQRSLDEWLGGAA